MEVSFHCGSSHSLEIKPKHSKMTDGAFVTKAYKKDNSNNNSYHLLDVYIFVRDGMGNFYT